MNKSQSCLVWTGYQLKIRIAQLKFETIKMLGFIQIVSSIFNDNKS